MTDLREFYGRDRSHQALTAFRDAVPPLGDSYHAALAHLAAHRGGRLLELGYGNVRNAGLYARWTDAAVLADIVDRTGGAALPDNVSVIRGDFNRDWPLAEGSFDVVVASNVFEHLFDPFHSFAELARVLRPGGIAFVGLPLVTSLRRRLALLAGRMPVTSEAAWFDKRCWDGGHLHLFTIADTRRCAALHGLDCVAVTPCGRHARIKALWPSLLCAELTFHFAKSR